METTKTAGGASDGADKCAAHFPAAKPFRVTAHLKGVPQGVLFTGGTKDEAIAAACRLSCMLAVQTEEGDPAPVAIVWENGGALGEAARGKYRAIWQ